MDFGFLFFVNRYCCELCWSDHTQAGRTAVTVGMARCRGHTCNAGALTFQRLSARRQCGEHGAHGEGGTLLAEPLTDRMIGLAIEVHRHIGPGLLEFVYELRLCRELANAGIAFARQVTMPVLYKGVEIGDGFKADIVVAGELILEIKAVSTILPIRAVQLRTAPT